MEYIDIGLNLFCDQFKGKEETIMQNAADNGVGIIITGSTYRSSKEASNYVSSHPGVYCTAGVHPHAAST
ncbi:MAG: TatD family hydrolase, partial [Oscillospiraceae bacterium]|nr:TatD family hydrolase [Oscillospiraceae bacterium]